LIVGSFCLVHGAWHGAWCWDPLARELRERGHDVRTPTLPSDNVDAGLGDWVHAIGPQHDAVVVGHSFAGFVTPLVEARAYVYLCAFAPVPGQPPGAVLGEALDPEFSGTEKDELGRSYWPSLEVARERLYRGHHDTWATWAFPKLRPQAQQVAAEPCPLERLPARPTWVVLAREDPAVRAAWLRETSKTVFGRPAVEVDGGHFPMFDRPVELAEVLEAVANDVANERP
jgi:pimeloyl-ACP methyl ester carboxylesterase